MASGKQSFLASGGLELESSVPETQNSTQKCKAGKHWRGRTFLLIDRWNTRAGGELEGEKMKAGFPPCLFSAPSATPIYAPGVSFMLHN